MLLLYKRVFLWDLNQNLDKKRDDVNFYEIGVYSILVILIFIIGIKPGLILSYTTSSLERIIQLYPISIFWWDKFHCLKNGLAKKQFQKILNFMAIVNTVII